MTQPQQQQNDACRIRESCLPLDLSIPTTGAFDCLLTTPDVEKLQLTTPDIEKFLTNLDSLMSAPMSTEKDEQKPDKTITNQFLTSPNHKSSAIGVDNYFISFSTDDTNVGPRKENGPEQMGNHCQSSSASSCSGGEHGYDGCSSSSEIGSVISNQNSQDGLLDTNGSTGQSDKAKQEQLRESNRLRAQKCLSKKLDKITSLDDKRNMLENENRELEKVLAELLEDVQKLKLEVQEHSHTGCSIAVGTENTARNM